MPPRKQPTEYDTLIAQGFEPDQARKIMLSKAERVLATTAKGAAAIEDQEPVVAIKRQESVTRGGDPDALARTRAAMAQPEPAPSSTVFEVTLEPRWADVMTVYRDILRGQRNRPDLTIDEAIAQLCRWASQAHPDILMVRSRGKSTLAVSK